MQALSEVYKICLANKEILIMLKAVLICVYVCSGAQELALCQAEGTEAKRQ